MARPCLALLAERGRPGDPALLTDERILSYAQLADAVGVAERRLAAHDLDRGGRVALCVGSTPELVIDLLAALRRGASVALISDGLGPAACRYRLEAFDPELVIDASCWRRRPRSSGEPGVPGTVAMWTSGSSGPPRAVLLEGDGLAWNAAANAAGLGLTAADRALVLVDAAHCYGLVHQILSHLSVGGSAVLPSRPAWTPDLGARARAWGVTTLAAVPAMLKALACIPSLDEAPIRQLTVGGATAPPASLAALAARLPAQVYVTYGLTEAGPRVSTLAVAPGARPVPGQVGRPLAGVELRLAGDGELLVRSPSVRWGYLVDGRPAPADPWLPTGDLARLDGSGGLELRGRKRRLINRLGLKVLPWEIERVLLGDPAVREARVVAHAHPRFGEVPRALIVAAGARPSPEALARRCLEELGLAWVPDSIEIVDALPPAAASWKDEDQIS